MKRIWCLSIIVSVVLTTTLLEAQDRIVLSKPDIPPDIRGVMAERILQEAYKRLGVVVEYKLYPGERALIVANAGGTDGEVARIEGMEKMYPNLIRVSVPIAYSDLVVFTTDPQVTVTGWESLRPYYVCIVRGMKLAEIKTQGMKVDRVTRSEQLFKKLARKRNDVGVYLRSGYCEVKKLNLSEIRIVEPPIEQLVFYHYLHKRHQGSVKKLEEILRQMEHEKYIDAIYQQVKEEFSRCLSQ